MNADAMRTAYEHDGAVFLRGAVPADVAASLAARVRAASSLAELRRNDVFAPIATPQVRQAISAILGSDAAEPSDWGGALVTEPTPGRWRTPWAGWHLDYPVRGAPAVELRLKWFAHLEPVKHGGGATMLIAGSHRLVADWVARSDPADAGRSAAVRDAIFATSPWFDILRDKDATDRETALSEGAMVNGVRVRVVELVGDAGDVVLVHPHLLHAASPNHGDRTRLMVAGGLEIAR